MGLAVIEVGTLLKKAGWLMAVAEIEIRIRSLRTLAALPE